MEKIIREKKVKLIYTKQAQMILNSMKNMTIEKFEDEWCNEVIIGDKAITAYVIDKAKKKEKENGTERK